MEKWEYKVLSFDSNKTSRDIEKEINNLGNEGWELVTATNSNGNKAIYLKRRKES